MADKNRIVAWDSCVIIWALEKRDDYENVIRPYIDDAEAGDLKIVVSEISRVEVARLDGLLNKGIDPTAQHKLIDDWFENEYVVRKPPIPGITDLAVDIARKYNVRGNDAIIAATAVFYNVPILHTGDGSGRNKGAKLIPLDKKLGQPRMRIRKPNPAEDTLWDKSEKQKEQ